LSLDLPNEEPVPKNEQSAQIIYIDDAHYYNTDFGKTNPICSAEQGRNSHWRAIAERLMKAALIVEGLVFADPGFRLAAVGSL
jgi:hypothetical protein